MITAKSNDVNSITATQSEPCAGELLTSTLVSDWRAANAAVDIARLNVQIAASLPVDKRDDAIDHAAAELTVRMANAQSLAARIVLRSQRTSADVIAERMCESAPTAHKPLEATRTILSMVGLAPSETAQSTDDAEIYESTDASGERCVLRHEGGQALRPHRPIAYRTGASR